MTSLQELYNSKKVTPQEALSHIKSGDVIHTSLCAMEPFTLLAHLHTIAERGVKDVVIATALEMRAYPYNSDPKYRETIRNESMFLMPAARKLLEAGLIDYTPTDLHNMATRRFGYKKPTVGLLSVTPRDSPGYLYCSLSQMQESDIVDAGAAIIAEVNPNIPVVFGDTAIHISKIKCLIETDTPVPQLPKAALDETDHTIGQYIAELVHDGDTIQLGIGGIPDAAAMAFVDKKDLGVHTEMLTNSVSMLVEKGVVTGSRKSLHPGKIIATFAFGDQKLYDMMNRNPAVAILRATYVNDPFVVAQNDNFVSVNSCISIDLTGQVASESIGPAQYSGTGGATDTAYGAIHAKNGRSIIAAHATAKNGEVSTITATLPPGAIVSLRRNHVDYFVTEFGIAPLRGRSVRERVNNLIAVAHPNFRERLRAEAQKLGLH